jgi:protein CrcB
VNFVVVALGAIFGANLRYIVSRYAAKVLGPVFPYGTLLINVVGSFVVGWFVIWSTERVLLDPRWRLLIVVGFCGGFTTFSSYAFESMAQHRFEQRPVPIGGAGGNGCGAGALECQTQWRCKSQSI